MKLILYRLMLCFDSRRLVAGVVSVGCKQSAMVTPRLPGNLVRLSRCIIGTGPFGATKSEMLKTHVFSGVPCRVSLGPFRLFPMLGTCEKLYLPDV